MARQPRFALAGQPQHIVQKGNNQQHIFKSDRDCSFYLEKLFEKSIMHGLEIHAYVLMPNHTHILVTPTSDKSISKVLQSLGRCYAQYYNYIYQRTGTLFEGRYRATLVDSDSYLLDCYKYIELNPVRSGIVQCPSNYLWSSYHHNALGVTDKIITPHKKYVALESELYSCTQNYADLFLKPLDPVVIDEITEYTDKSWVLGSNDFKNFIEKILNRRSSPKPRGGDRKSVNWNANRI